MNGRERILAHLTSRPVDRLPLMPITMQFACDLIGAKYHNYETDYHVLVEGQLRVADLFEFVVEMELRFARTQIEAGADLIGVGDAAASLVGPQIYEEFVWPYERKLIDGLHALGTKARLHICGNTRFALSGMGRLGCEIVDLDSLSPIAEGRMKMGANQILLGNVNPVTVLRGGTPEVVFDALAECHRQAGARYIVLISGMIVHKASVHEFVARCRRFGKVVVAGGPQFMDIYVDEMAFPAGAPVTCA
ncbi:MAG: uroporphyrinogen decarboxylase family protein [Acidobacteria bacterium]|nr:uroporphyrinogen decarboxylase family protein [Acidobacteriota bacterium]